MGTLNKSLGYTTHILGTVNAIKQCLGIVVYNKDSFNTRISLYNIEEVYTMVTKQGAASSILTRDSDQDDFIFISEDHWDVIKGFDTIIYLSVIDNSPIGYTEFLNRQGYGKNISLSINPTASLEDGDVKLINTLSELQGSTTSFDNDLIGDEAWKYVSIKRANEQINSLDKCERYTKNIKEMLNGGVIKTSCGTVYDGKVNLFGINRDAAANLYHVNFTKRNLGYYSGDFVIYSFLDSNKFCVTSLTKVNRFGNPIVYTKDGDGYYTIPDEGVEIQYGAGRYIVCKVTINGAESTKLYDFEKRQFSEITSGNIVINPLDLNTKVYRFPSVLTTDTIFEYIPELEGIYYLEASDGTMTDIKTYVSKYTPEVYRIIDSWFIMRRKYKYSGYLYSVAGYYNSVIMAEEDLQHAHFLNDNTIILEEDTYYVLYTGVGKTYWTERAKKLVNSDLEKVKAMISGVPVTVYVEDKNRIPETIYSLYDSRIAPKTKSVKETFFNSYRKLRNINVEDERKICLDCGEVFSSAQTKCPKCLSSNVDFYCLPEFIAMGKGVIIYKDGYNLNYL